MIPRRPRGAAFAEFMSAQVAQSSGAGGNGACQAAGQRLGRAPERKATMTTAITPGTFDPITLGHLDIITRAAALMDDVVVAVAASAGKNPLFSLKERAELARKATEHLPNVTVEPFDNLLVDFAKQHDAKVVIKGLRAITDFEYEFQMNALNRHFDNELETTFIMSSPKYMYLSSSVVRELASLGGDVTQFVPPCVIEALQGKYPLGHK